jgi:hypothetical protein
MDSDKPEIEYNCSKNWWGSTPEGIQNTASLASKKKLKVLLKPHFWVDNKGWAGELSFSKKKWIEWEANYEEYILYMAGRAEELGFEMLCIGTEMKSSVNEHPQFWKKLIPKIRNSFSGKLIYAANWDNYHRIPFWEQLDYIGVDAYFPLSSKVTPGVGELLFSWQKHKRDLKLFSDSLNKPVIFTEMGYRSIDKGAWKQWEVENLADDKAVNHETQRNGYQSIFESFWDEKWFAGGFLWKWKFPDYESGGVNHSDYSPQNKPVEKLIKKWYLKECIPHS